MGFVEVSQESFGRVELRVEMWGVSLSLFALVVGLELRGTVCVGIRNGNVSRDDFPDGFVFGAASSAYQTEGAANEDGRTPSIWDTFAKAGSTKGATGDIACDGYHKYKEDVQLMAKTRLEAYRFSISWSRLIPNGRGPVNPKGLEYYNNFIDELVSHGIEPHVTLHHSDLPQILEDEYGGWVSRKIVKDFTEYADVCFREFGDRVKHWTTMNEPNLFVWAGYDMGDLPPQRCSRPFGNCSRGNSTTEPYIAAHHILLAHASAFRLYEGKYKDKQHGFIGINILSFWFIPLTDSSEDELATKRANEFFIGWFLNPLAFGDYPDSMKKNAGMRIPTFTIQESKSVRRSFNFLGLNYYYGMYVKNRPSTLQAENRDIIEDMRIQLFFPDFRSSNFEFPIAPWGLAGVLEYIKQHYNNPHIYIHENVNYFAINSNNESKNTMPLMGGAWWGPIKPSLGLFLAVGQKTPRNSTLEDWPRVEYLQAFIGCVIDAIRNGTNVRGYFVWSLMDSFELLGESRFGLYYVDFDDPELKRTPKLSAHWYSHFLKRRSITLDGIVQSSSGIYF